MPGRLVTLASSLAAFFVAVAAQAGSVYVPIADPQIDGLVFTPQVVLSNHATASRSFTRWFIAENSDGTERSGTPVTATVAAGETNVLQPAAVAGLIEMTGVADMVVGASMVGTSGAGEATEFPLPIVSSSNLFAAGTTAHLQGLQRDAAHRSALYLANLGHSTSLCSVTLLDAKGTTLLGPVSLTLKALALHRFPDALAGVAGGAAEQARATVRCDRPFYAFALVQSAAARPFVATVLPSATGASTLEPPSPAKQLCDGSSAAHCYAQSGLVFAPAKGVANEKRIQWPVQSGTYSRLRLRMEVQFSGVNAINPAGLHQFFWLALNGRNWDLYGFTSLGDGNQRLMLRTGVGLGPGVKSKIVENASLVPGNTVVLDYIYDTGQRQASWSVTDKASGALVARLLDVPNVSKIQVSKANSWFECVLSMGGSNPAEPPSWGWRYSNVVFELFR